MTVMTNLKQHLILRVRHQNNLNPLPRLLLSNRLEFVLLWPKLAERWDGRNQARSNSKHCLLLFKVCLSFSEIYFVANPFYFILSKFDGLTLPGRDIIGLAETGSGKTGAFALPIIQSLLDNPQPFYALVLAPTRCDK